MELMWTASSHHPGVGRRFLGGSMCERGKSGTARLGRSERVPIVFMHVGTYKARAVRMNGRTDDNGQPSSQTGADTTARLDRRSTRVSGRHLGDDQRASQRAVNGGQAPRPSGWKRYQARHCRVRNAAGAEPQCALSPARHVYATVKGSVAPRGWH